MAFVWTTNEYSKLIITIYPTNVTLNKAACQFFKEVNYVLLGIDEDNHEIGIKPLSKNEIDMNLYPEDSLHKISLGKSYGRITSKSFINTLNNVTNQSITDNHCLKIDATYDKAHRILKGNYSKGVVV